jgi:hypothetical protein
MPFVCKFQLNNGAISDSDEVIFIKYVDESFGDYHLEKIKIASVLFNMKPAFIYSNCACFPSTKGHLEKGDKITSKTEIGYFSADGEDIPYYKPYATIQYE